MKNAYKISVWKFWRKGSKASIEIIITKGLIEIGSENVIWINLAQDKVQKHGLLKR